MAYTKSFPFSYSSGSNNYTIPELVGSDSGLSVEISDGGVVTVVSFAAGTVSIVPDKSFGNTSMTATQDNDWADSSGTLIVTEHPIKTEEVIQIETNRLAIIGLHADDDTWHNRIIANENDKVATTTTVNGKALSADIALDFSDTGAEQQFSKNSGFNKSLGTVAGTVAEGNHAHSQADITGLVSSLAGKLSVTSVVNNLTTNDSSKVLSSEQGVALKTLIDNIGTPVDISTKVDKVTGSSLVTDGNIAKLSTMLPIDSLGQGLLYDAVTKELSVGTIIQSPEESHVRTIIVKNPPGLGNSNYYDIDDIGYMRLRFGGAHNTLDIGAKWDTSDTGGRKFNFNTYDFFGSANREIYNQNISGKGGKWTTMNCSPGLNSFSQFQILIYQVNYAIQRPCYRIVVDLLEKSNRDKLIVSIFRTGNNPLAT